MAYFAEIVDGLVVRVLSVPDSEEDRGHQFLSNDLNLGGRWVKTSYNTRGGVHLLGGTPLRKNYAGLGYTYDEARDAFIPPKPYPSWVLNEDTCLWESPVPYPEGDGFYTWDEDSGSWVVVE